MKLTAAANWLVWLQDRWLQLDLLDLLVLVSVLEALVSDVVSAVTLWWYWLASQVSSDSWVWLTGGRGLIYEWCLVGSEMSEWVSGCRRGFWVVFTSSVAHTYFLSAGTEKNQRQSNLCHMWEKTKIWVAGRNTRSDKNQDSGEQEVELGRFRSEDVWFVQHLQLHQALIQRLKHAASLTGNHWAAAGICDITVQSKLHQHESWHQFLHKIIIFWL